MQLFKGVADKLSFTVDSPLLWSAEIPTLYVLNIKTMNLLMPALSAYISYIMPVALGIYWLLGSVLQIFSQMIIDKMIENQSKKEENNKLLGEGDKK